MKYQKFRVTFDITYRGHSKSLSSADVKNDLSLESEADAFVFEYSVADVQPTIGERPQRTNAQRSGRVANEAGRNEKA